MTPTFQIEDHLVSSFESECERRVEQLEAIVLLDFRESYKDDGARSMSDWLAYRFGYDESTARELVRVAKALDFLPAIKDNYRQGLLCWDKVRWLASFATFAEDVEWSERAIGMSASEIRSVALERKRLTRELADARFKRRYVRARRDIEGGGGRMWGFLSDVEFETVLKAIDRRAKLGPADVPFEQRRADALTEICSLALGADSDPDRATVVAHVELEALKAGEGNGLLEGGVPIAAETVRRITCDGRLQVVLHTTEGIIASKTTRTVPVSLSRELRRRDGKCVFPGCENDIWLHAHHIEHHADGGETVLSNLALLCGFHHRLVHEGGWKMYLTAEGDYVFVRPDGRPLFVHRKHGREAKTVAAARAP